MKAAAAEAAEKAAKDAKAAKQAKPASAMNPPVTAAPSAQAAPAPVHPAVKPQTYPAPSRAKVMNEDWKVYAIHDGLVWILVNDHYEVAHVGETLSNGSRVTSIDPAKMEVMTTKGVIRANY